MRAVDTSAWVEVLKGSSRCVPRLVREMPQPGDWVIPTIVQLELAKWIAREKGGSTAEAVLSFATKCRVVDLNTRIAIDAAGFCIRYNLATADAIVYATARACDADLLTCDARFKDLPHVVYVPKTSA